MKITIEHNGKTYEFNGGVQAYIFDVGTLNGVPEEKLLEYIEFVYWLYIKDDRPTPLGYLADYIAENWDKGVMYLDKWTILEEFYDSLN